MSPEPDWTLSELRARIRNFVSAREWEQFHNPKNLSMSIAMEAAELMACFQWDSTQAIDEALRRDGPPAEALDELADVMIYCLAAANALGINNLGQVILDKLERSGLKYPADQFRGRFK